MTQPWLVKYDGTCRLCGTQLLKGTPAVWERATRSIRCIECPSPAEPPTDIPHISSMPSSRTSETAESFPPVGPEPRIDPGVAGGSARREYERRKAAHEERVRGNLGNRLGGIVLALTNEPQSTRAWAIGAKGEEKVAAALGDIPGLHVLHDRRVPGTRGNIDHIAISPAGIFVIDAKHIQGMIRIRDRGGLFRTDERLYVGSHDCSKLADGLLWQVSSVDRALSRAAVEPRPPVTPILCFLDGEWPLLFPPKAFRGVLLESDRSIRRVLTTAGDVEFDADSTAAALAAALPSK